MCGALLVGYDLEWSSDMKKCVNCLAPFNPKDKKMEETVKSTGKATSITRDQLRDALRALTKHEQGKRYFTGSHLYDFDEADAIIRWVQQSQWAEFLQRQARNDAELSPEAYTRRNREDPGYMERQYKGR